MATATTTKKSKSPNQQLQRLAHLALQLVACTRLSTVPCTKDIAEANLEHAQKLQADLEDLLFSDKFQACSAAFSDINALVTLRCESVYKAYKRFNKNGKFRSMFNKMCAAEQDILEALQPKPKLNLYLVTRQSDSEDVDVKARYVQSLVVAATSSKNARLLCPPKQGNQTFVDWPPYEELSALRIGRADAKVVEAGIIHTAEGYPPLLAGPSQG